MSVEFFTSKNMDKAVDNAMTQALLKIAGKVTAQAKEFTAIDTGRLKGSIMWKSDVAESASSSEKLTVNPKHHEVYVGSAVNYAVYQEFGTRRMQPHPYLRPAVAIKALGRPASDVVDIVNKEMQLGKLENGKERYSFF